MLLSAEARTAAVDLVTADDFYRPVHGHIFDAVRNIHGRGEPVDATITADELGRAGLLDAVGGLSTLLSLQINTPASSNAARYARIVAEHALLRRLIGVAGEIAELGYANADDVGAAVTRASQLVAEVAASTTPIILTRPPATAAALRAAFLDGDAIAEIPSPAPLIDGLLMRDSIAALYGRSASGKSFVAVDWALSVATGSWWYGRAVHPGRVLYIVAEGAAGMRDRLEAWKTHRRVHTAGTITWLPLAVNLLDDTATVALATVASELQPTFVIIDTLARAMPGGDENKSADMGTIVQAAEAIRAASGGACVLLVHHTGKDAAAGLRGHSSLEAALETSIELKTADGILELQVAKQKNGPDGDKLRLRLVNVGKSCALDLYRGDDPTDELPPAAVEVLTALAEIDTGTGATAGVWEEATGHARRTFYRWRKRLLDLGLIAPTDDTVRARWSLTDAGREALDPAYQASEPDPDEEF